MPSIEAETLDTEPWNEYEELELPPSYTERAGSIRDDGCIDVDPDSCLSRTLLSLEDAQCWSDNRPPVQEESQHASDDKPKPFQLRLNIVIQVVGSRGDVQPFVALGTALQAHGHRVRIATHARFEAFIRAAALEFYSIGGDPEQLMSYMVKNPGLLPSMQSLRAGEIARKRAMIAEILEGCWRSCIEPDLTTQTPFVADAIIANPPSFAHFHCAQALGIPLHIAFTMPWTKTRSFPHPLANIVTKPEDVNLTNYLSYITIDWMTWNGIGDIVNDFRNSLGLEACPNSAGPLLTTTNCIPHTYCWSQALLPKPKDWPAHVNVSGFFFRESPAFTPPDDLRKFLAAGPPPVYIGFGSIVLDDPARLSSIILDAVTSTGSRAIISHGWSRLNGPEHPDVYWVDDCPHEWLFQHVATVVHHGGAGTTACGLRNAVPQVVVPFFGDQNFWGTRIAAVKAGPKPIPHKALNAENLADAILFCRSKSVQDAAAHIASQIRAEDGVQSAVALFHQHLPLKTLKCDILPDQPAAWLITLNHKPVHLSTVAAHVLLRFGAIHEGMLKLYQTDPKVINSRHWDPATGTASSLAGTTIRMATATVGIFSQPYKTYLLERKRPCATQPEASLPNTLTDEAVNTSLNNNPTPDQPAVQLYQKPLAASMALASGKSLGRFFTIYTKGILVDMPLATAEGFRAVPRLWGDHVEDYGEALDWKSGVIKAGRTFVEGIADGTRDLSTLPGQGAKDEGYVGFAKGMGKGTASLLTKAVGGTLGLVAYPGQGIARSLFSLSHGSTRRAIAQARRVDGDLRAQNITASTTAEVMRWYHDKLRESS